MTPCINCKEETSPPVHPFHQREDAEGRGRTQFFGKLRVFRLIASWRCASCEPCACQAPRHSEECQRRRIFKALLYRVSLHTEGLKILHSGSLRLPPFRMTPGINCKEGTSPFVHPFRQRGDAEGAKAQSFSVSFAPFASLRPRVVLHANHAPAKPPRHSEERQRRRIFEALREVTRPRP